MICVSIDLHRVARLIPGYDPFATAGDAWFDADAAQRAIDFFPLMLRHVEGVLAGEPFNLEPWQQAIVANLFGWKRKDAKGRTVRRYRECLVFVPRKNGKTPLVAGIGLYCLFTDKERGQQNYIAASTREQAGLMFRHCRGMVEQEPELERRCRIYGGNAPGGNAQSIVREDRSSFLKVIAGDVSVGKHGKNINVAIVDELHELPGRDLVDTLKTSMVSANKPQPLLIYATTSDYERPSICNEIHDRACKIRDGVLESAEFLPVVYEAKTDDDWTAPETWRAANPNMGISVSEEAIAAECKRAQEEPAYENTFKRLHLDVRTEQSVRLIPMDQWDACRGELPALEGLHCFAGLDLATVSDLAALTLVFPLDGGRYALKPFFWCPRATAEKRQKNLVNYLDWARAGHVELTDTETLDFGRVMAKVLECSRQYRLGGVAYDPWNATHVANILEQQHGLKLVMFRQGFVSMNEPTKTLLRLLAEGKLLHDGNPVLRWMASNAAGKFENKAAAAGLDGMGDAAANLKPDKAASGDKIDGIVATIMGLGLALAQPQLGSVYDQRDMLYV